MQHRDAAVRRTLEAVFVGERRALIPGVEAEMRTPAQGRGRVFRYYVKSHRRLHLLELFTNLVRSVETASYACLRLRQEPIPAIRRMQAPITSRLALVAGLGSAARLADRLTGLRSLQV